MGSIKIHPLIVTVDPCLDSKNITCNSSGVVAKCMSSKTLAPVPSCYSSKKFEVDCVQSGDPFVPAPVVGGPYRMQLRDLLREDIAGRAAREPRTLKQVRALEERLRRALKTVAKLKRELSPKRRKKRSKKRSKKR